MSVLYEKKGKIAYVTLNRPEVMNALNKKTFEELRQIWTDFNQDPQLWAAIIDSTGNKAFLLLGLI